MKLFVIALMSLMIGLVKFASAQNLSEAYNTLKYKESRFEAESHICFDLAFGHDGQKYAASQVCQRETDEMKRIDHGVIYTGVSQQEALVKFTEESQKVEAAYRKCTEDFFRTCWATAKKHLESKK